MTGKSEGKHESSKTKRDRCANYTDQETRLLVDLVIENKEIIENKVSDAVTWKEKAQTWDKITLSFNARSSASIHRDATNLRNKYEALKKALKKKVAKEKCDIYITGGGTKVVVIYTDWEEKLLAILKLSVCGLLSKYDSDGPVSQPLALAQPELATPAAVTCEGLPSPGVKHDSNTGLAGSSEIIIVCAAETEEASTSKENEVDLTADTVSACNTNISKKWETWTPTSLRKRKSAPLRKQHSPMVSKKDTINSKYDELAEQRNKLVNVQLEIAAKELDNLNKKVLHEEEMRKLEKDRLINLIKFEQEEQQAKLEILKQQLRHH